MVKISIDYSLFAYPKPNYKNRHKRTKATDIDTKLKKVVWERDGHKCIFCGKMVSVNCANAHYTKRSQGGLGIEENIVTLCSECHFQEDFGKHTKLYEDYIEKYLKRIYGENWSKEKLIYKK